MRRFALCSLLSLGFAFPAVAQYKPSRPDLTPADLESYLGTRWYGVYVGGTKSGYASRTLERRETDATAVYVLREVTSLQLSAEGAEPHVSVTEKVFEGGPPYRLQRSSCAERRGEGVVERTVEPAPLGPLLRIREDGEERTLHVMPVYFTLIDELFSEHWIRGQPRPGDKLPVDALDPGTWQQARWILVVKGTRRVRAGSLVTQVYDVEHQDLDRSAVATATMDAQGRLLNLKMSEVETRLEPEAVAKERGAAVDLLRHGLVRVSTPLGDPSGVSRLELRIVGSGWRSIAPGPLQTVEELGGEAVRVVVDRRGSPAPAAPWEAEWFLKETPVCPARDPRVLELAAIGVGDASDPRTKIERLVRFVSEYVQDVVVSSEPSVLTVIRTRAGDCSEHARLFTALARAAGVPCREVWGVVYAGDELQAFAPHAWNEVLLDGHWEAVDPSWNEVAINATHIRLGAERSWSDAMPLASTLRFEVLLPAHPREGSTRFGPQPAPD